MLRHTTAILIGAVAGIGTLIPACRVVPLPSADAETNPAQTADALPIVKVVPVYPGDAILNGTEGYVVLEFVITETGTVRDPVIVDAEPPGVFDQASIDAVLSFKYRPRVVDGKPVETTGMRNRFVFEMDTDVPDSQRIRVSVGPHLATAPSEGEVPLPIVKVAPIYPRHALVEKIEGRVLLEFVVTETGAVRDPVILDAKPRGVFGRAALGAVANFKYEPKVVDGKPQETAGVHNLIVFEIAD